VRIVMFDFPWGVTEDDLTRSFFGLMKHLPPNVLLKPFIELINTKYKLGMSSADVDDSVDILLWQSYEIPPKWQTDFKEKSANLEKKKKYYIVPDAVIELKKASYVFIIEAEYSKDFEPEQMFQQFLVCRCIFEPQGKARLRPYHLIINKEYIPPKNSLYMHIRERAEELGEVIKIDEIKNSVLWLTWHDIGKLCEEAKKNYFPKVNSYETLTIFKLLASLDKFMIERGFYPIKLFSADNPGEIQPSDIQLRSIQIFNILPTILTNNFDPTLIPSLSYGLIDIDNYINKYYREIFPEHIPQLNVIGRTSEWLASLYIPVNELPTLNQGG